MELDTILDCGVCMSHAIASTLSQHQTCMALYFHSAVSAGSAERSIKGAPVLDQTGV